MRGGEDCVCFSKSRSTKLEREAESPSILRRTNTSSAPLISPENGVTIGSNGSRVRGEIDERASVAEPIYKASSSIAYLIMGSYCCFKCQNLIAFHDDIVSKDFQARSGRAFLFGHAINIKEGPKEDRQLITGLHTVSDVYCSDCGEELGWKYVRAYEASQKYKEGKIILEKFKIVRTNHC
ncbi:protein yippee-like [Senna tora]|uniref:Protein yippee-like n=1 Tax=Senna tora TaxID=362788 RepID=A0A834TYA7_9FABA|nr:protein yippee-like [Senna tora]